MSHPHRKRMNRQRGDSLAARQDRLARLEAAALEMLRDLPPDTVTSRFFGPADLRNPRHACNPGRVVAFPCIPSENPMSQSVVQIQHEDHVTSGRYAATLPGIQDQAELTWRAAGPGVIVADHTYAPPAMRGSGAAGALVDRLIQDARHKGLRIIPACSYVEAQFDRHPEWSDLRAQG